MRWRRKNTGIRVAINHQPRRFPGSPYFGEQFLAEAKRQGRSAAFWKDAEKPDILLVIDCDQDWDRLEHFRNQGAKLVQRVDGAGIKDSQSPRSDNPIYQTYEKCDAVIFQSHFCREIWERSFSLDKPCFIALNGADENILSRQGPKTDFGFKRMMVTAARWRPWKGLDQAVEVFQKLDREDLGLAVLGDGAEVPSHPRIKVTGKLSHKEMARVFRAAELFIYLPWQEWCPKVVAQALVSGLPVVCSYRGGTKELVQDCGIAARGAKDDDLEDFGPNPVDIDEAVKASNAILDQRKKCRERPDLYLSTMVRNYFEIFEKVMGNAG